MSFVEKFRRTPKFIAWLITAALSYGIGIAFAWVAFAEFHPILAVFAMFSRDDSWGILITFVMAFASMAAFMMLGLAWVLRLHHEPSLFEMLLAIPVACLWPAWMTIVNEEGIPFSNYLMFWAMYLPVVLVLNGLCVRLIHRGRHDSAPRRSWSFGADSKSMKVRP